MTVAFAHPSPTQTSQIIQGSHTAEIVGDRVVVRDLELFCGFDPQIDKADAPMSRYSRDRVREVVKCTQAYMSRGQRPKIVVKHEKTGNEPDYTVGDVITLRSENRNGVEFIIGDVEMSKDDFAYYMLSNRYPRRSAEIWNAEGYMSEVALLGRETPRRPVPDTRFSRDSADRDRFDDRELPRTQFQMVGVGGGANTFTPSTGKEKPMSETEDTNKSEMARMSKLIKRLCEKVGVTDDDDDKPKDDNGRSGDDTKDFNARVEARVSEVTSGLVSNIKDLQGQLNREKFGRKVDQMATDGYSIAKHRDKMIAELSACKDEAEADGKIAFWRETMQRMPLNTRIDLRHTGTGGDSTGGDSTGGESDQEFTARVAREAAGDPAKAQKMLNERYGKKDTAA